MIDQKATTVELPNAAGGSFMGMAQRRLAAVENVGEVQNDDCLSAGAPRGLGEWHRVMSSLRG